MYSWNRLCLCEKHDFCNIASSKTYSLLRVLDFHAWTRASTTASLHLSELPQASKQHDASEFHTLDRRCTNLHYMITLVPGLDSVLICSLCREWSPVDANEYGDMKCWLRSDPNTILNTVTFDNSQIMFAYVATIDNHYYNNMVCSLTWDLPTGWNAAVSFPACGLVNSGAHCAQDNITVQLHDSMALRCGGVIEMLDATYTHRQRLELTFESDESGYGPGCTALGWSHQC